MSRSAWGLVAFVFVLVQGVGGIATAQITSAQSSREFLASQCATSAGSDVESFRDYGAKLAVTLSRLSPAQQERVFGYLPRPGATSAPMNAGNGSDRFAGTTPPTAEGNGVGLLEGLIDTASEALGELLMPDSEPISVIAGTPPPTIPAAEPSPAVPATPGAQEPASPTEQGSQSDPVDDGNNGHGNSGGFDPGNPGKGGDKSSSRQPKK